MNVTNLFYMYKNLLFLIIQFGIGSFVYAQVKGPVKRESTLSSTVDANTVLDVREKLVQLALQNPNLEIADRKIAISELELKKAQGEWLAAIVPSLNLNELTIKPSKGNQQFFPLWNVGVSVPLNYFTLHRTATSIAKENRYIAAAEKNEKYRQTRTKVLTKYEDYLMYEEALSLQNRVTEDAFLSYRQKESDFKDDLIGIEDYNKSFAMYKEQLDKRLQARRNFNVSKLELEEIIGVSLDEVLSKK